MTGQALSWRPQRRPDRPGFPRYHVDLASAELPCGASWLGNLLLEIGVPIWDPWGADTRSEWKCIGHRRFRYQREDEGWRRLLPGLVHERVYNFRKGPVPRLGHHWPRQYSTLPAILVVRDPRDALFSAWRRERSLSAISPDLSFVDFINSPFRTWPFSWAAYLSLHTAAWSAQIANVGGMLLRFEDFKRKPLEQARRVLSFLGLRAHSHALERAIAASDHAQIKCAEANLIQRRSVPMALLAGGQVEEWRSHYAAEMHARLPNWIWRVFEPLGYQPLIAGSDLPPPSSGEIAQILGRDLMKAAAPEFLALAAVIEGLSQ